MKSRFRSGGVTAAVLTALAGMVQAAEERVAVVDAPPAEPRTGWYAGNRAPLAPSPFLRLPVGAITPKGWLRQQLELDAAGLCGHLPQVSGFVQFKGNAWSNPDGKGGNGWEELPYWLKGFGDLGYVLRDERITAGAKPWIEAILASQKADGWFGPESAKTSLDGRPDLWPHMLVLDIMRSYHEFTGDARVLAFMRNYFKWEAAQPPETFRAGFWPNMRFGDNLDSIYWLYNRTGDAWLLDLARVMHANMAKWSEGVINLHNVNISQGFRVPTQFWVQESTNTALRAGAERNYQWIMDRVGQFPGGGFAGDENVRLHEGDPRQGFETCGFVELMRSFEMLARITGEPLWADRCEEIAFNGLPAALDPAHKGLHYMTSANLIRCDFRPRPGFYTDGWCRSGYSAVNDRCCLHNYGFGWPYYAEELWLATPDRGLCAALYAASEVRAKAGAKGVEVKVVEETDYPFGETIRLRVAAPEAVAFPLYLRVPRWCEGAAVKVNGRAVGLEARPLSYVVVDRTWKDGDTVELALPMRLAVRTWAKNQDSVTVDRGPLTFSLKIGEDWHEVPGGRPGWPNLEVTPTSPWNYGLEIDPAKPEASIKVGLRRVEPGANPFTLDGVPIELTAKARRIPGWIAERSGAMPKLRPSPARSAAALETVTLVPMGAARLRLASFPTVSTAATAHDWPVPPAADLEITASHEADSIDALADGKIPKSSLGEGAARFTWWPQKGTAEWVQYTFGKPRKIAGVSVYWFDDTGHGECRVPKSWTVQYRDGAAWKPVKTTEVPGVQKDVLQTLNFEPVETTALRLEVQLQPEVSGGLLEWNVLP